MCMAVVYLGFGSNQGDKLFYIIEAIKAIEARVGKVLDCSPIFQSEAWGFESENVFLNLAVKVDSGLHAKQILRIIQEIEQSLGRERSCSGYSDRTIDIDILLLEDTQISTPELRIPHSQMIKRQFVLQPLEMIASEVIHPVEKVSIKELAARCTDKTIIKEVYSKAEIMRLIKLDYPL